MVLVKQTTLFYKILASFAFLGLDCSRGSEWILQQEKLQPPLRPILGRLKIWTVPTSVVLEGASSNHHPPRCAWANQTPSKYLYSDWRGSPSTSTSNPPVLYGHDDSGMPRSPAEWRELHSSTAPCSSAALALFNHSSGSGPFVGLHVAARARLFPFLIFFIYTFPLWRVGNLGRDRIFLLLK